MGASKFTLADMLSQMNHLDDITHDKHFGAAMGFSWAEIEAAFGPHVEALAGSRNETILELRAEMWRRYSGYCYDGHHKVYFAWDVSCALQKQVVENFWLDHGQPEFSTTCLSDGARSFPPPDQALAVGSVSCWCRTWLRHFSRKT